MATSSNANIQKLIQEVDAIDANDLDLEAKLQDIAQKVAQEQRKVVKTGSDLTGAVFDDRTLIDPGDAFACEGCQ